MKKLEDALLKLKFDSDTDDFTYGQQEAIKFWTLDNFNKDLEKAMKLNMNDEYIQGIVSGLKYNIKIMEETKDEQTSYASTN